MRRSRWLLLAGVYGAWRIGELWLSARHERRLDREGVPRRHERGFPLMVAAHLVPFVGGAWETARFGGVPSRARRIIRLGSLATLAAAAALRGWVIATLGKGWNVRIHTGRSMRVMTGGPYRYIRHPNYLAVILELAALPLAGGAYWTAAASSLLNGVALRARILDEEAALWRVPGWRRAMAGKPRLLYWPHGQ